MKHSVASRAAAACCAIALLAGCSQPAAIQSDDSIPAVRVSVTQPERGSLVQTAAYTGRISPDESVYVIPKVAGEVIETNFEVGDAVKAGDVLFRIDPTAYQIGVQQAEAAVDAINATIALTGGSSYQSQLISAESALKQAQSGKKWTEDTYDIYDESYGDTAYIMKQQVKATEAAMDQAKDAYDQARAAFEAGSVTADDVSIAQEAYSAARLAYQQAESSYESYVGSYKTQYNQLTQGLEQSEIGLDAAEKAYELVASGKALEEQLAIYNAQLEQANAAYESAKMQLSYTSVTSPIDGIIEQKNVSVNGFAAQSGYAYVVSNKDALSVTFNVPADTASSLVLGDTVTLETGGRSYTARIAEVANAVNAASGLFPVKALVEGDDSGLLSGVSVKLTAPIAKAEDALLLPVSLLYYDNGQPYVYVAADGAAHKTFVETGIVTAETAEIRSGLAGDDQVISSWNPNLMDGAAIETVEG